MKVLLVHKYFKYTGGAEVFFFEVGRILKENGHEVAFLSTKDSANENSIFSNYFITPPKYFSKNIFSKIKSIPKIIFNFESKIQMEAIVNDFKPDIVHLFGIFTQISTSILDITKKYNIPVLMSCNDYKHICPNYMMYYDGKICSDCQSGKYYKAILNKCCHNSYSVSTVSAFESYFNVKTNRIPNNVNLFLFASVFMQNTTHKFWSNFDFKDDLLRNPFDAEKYQISLEDDNYVLFFGKLIEVKGVDILIKAMSLNKNIKLIVVGDGREEEKLKNLKRDLELENVEFLGPIWGDDLNNYIKLARFVIVPSRWHENFPYVIIQSFAYGKPVIGSNRGGIPELLDNGKNGIIYDAENYTELARKISYLYNDKHECMRLGINAKNYVDNYYNSKEFYKNLMKIYNRILS